MIVTQPDKRYFPCREKGEGVTTLSSKPLEHLDGCIYRKTPPIAPFRVTPRRFPSVAPSDVICAARITCIAPNTPLLSRRCASFSFPSVPLTTSAKMTTAPSFFSSRRTYRPRLGAAQTHATPADLPAASRVAFRASKEQPFIRNGRRRRPAAAYGREKRTEGL